MLRMPVSVGRMFTLSKISCGMWLWTEPVSANAWTSTKEDFSKLPTSIETLKVPITLHLGHYLHRRIAGYDYLHHFIAVVDRLVDGFSGNVDEVAGADG